MKQHLDSIKERETETHTDRQCLHWRKKTIPRRISKIFLNKAFLKGERFIQSEEKPAYNKAFLSVICLRVMPINFGQKFN